MYSWPLNKYIRENRHGERNPINQLNSLCDQILESVNFLRFVVIPNKMGKLIASKYRNGLISLLTEQEIEIFAIESVFKNE